MSNIKKHVEERLEFFYRVESIIEKMKELNDTERLYIISHFCKSCGTAAPSCNCWNDE